MIETSKRYRYVGTNPQAPKELIGTTGVVTYVDTRHQTAHYRPDGWDYQIAVPINDLVKA